jgi:hypothetical protein
MYLMSLIITNLSDLAASDDITYQLRVIHNTWMRSRGCQDITLTTYQNQFYSLDITLCLSMNAGLLSTALLWP